MAATAGLRTPTAGRPTPTPSLPRVVPDSDSASSQSIQAVQLAVTQVREEQQQVQNRMMRVERFLETQDQRARHLADSVDRFGDTLERLSDAQRGHDESLKSLASAKQESYDPALQQTLAEVPISLNQLSDTLRTVLDRVIEQHEAITRRMLESQETLISRLVQAQEAILARLDGGRADQEKLLTQWTRSQGQLLAQLATQHEGLLARLESQESARAESITKLIGNQEALLRKLEASQGNAQDQLELIRQTQYEVSDGLKRLNGALEELSQSGRSTAESIKRIGLSEMEQRNSLSRLITRQARKMTWVGASIGTILVAATLAIIGLMIMHLDRPA